MSEKVINIGKCFSAVPAGRLKTDGPNSGERFRDEILVPALKENDSVVVELSDIEGVGSSFLEEAFGGIIRNHLLSYQELNSKLKITATPLFELCVGQIKRYIERAAENISVQ